MTEEPDYIKLISQMAHVVNVLDERVCELERKYEQTKCFLFQVAERLEKLEKQP